MFASEEIYNYHMQTIALSMFGNKNESFYINSGSGRNGKGVCSSFIEKAFGNYFYQGDSTFYTTNYNADRPNSTLYNLKGIRYFLTSEPENDSDSKFNIGMLKVTTGSDTITTRDLNKSNISYKPFFTPFVQCNKKPKIDNFEDAIKRRFKIIHFPYCFVDNPSKPNEKQIDINLKSQINQEYYNEFMLMIIDISKNNDKVVVPKEVLGNVDEYVNQNNTVLEFLQASYDFVDDDKERIRTSELLAEYNSSGDYNFLSPVKFAQALEMNKIKTKKYNTGKYVMGIKTKIIEEEI
jgi:putative DNA primase/helicase